MLLLIHHIKLFWKPYANELGTQFVTLSESLDAGASSYDFPRRPGKLDFSTWVESIHSLETNRIFVETSCLF